MSDQLEMNRGRRPDFQRVEQLEAVLKKINALVGDLEPDEELDAPRFPVLFVVGCPRSGSTLLLQWLASLGSLAYPSNLIARFYANPYLGALIQQMLLDYDQQNQLFDISKTFDFASQLGRTKGALAPSEFWYYWRQFFKFGEIQQLSEAELAGSDTATFVRKLAAFESVYQKPLAMKGMILNWHLPFLDSLFEKALFINVERETKYNAQSLYQARLNFFGNEENWFSYKPPEYGLLKEKSPLEQVAGQVYYTKKAVLDGLAHIDERRVLNVPYDVFCANPRSFYEKLRVALQDQDVSLPAAYPEQAPDRFEMKDTVKIDPEKFKHLEDHCRAFEASSNR